MGENTFSKEKIIKEKTAFRAAICSDLRVKSGGMVASARKNTLGVTRLGMCISKKMLSKSVSRNALKRKIRETFRTFASKEVVGFDIVVRVYRKPVGEIKELGQLWKKLIKACES